MKKRNVSRSLLVLALLIVGAGAVSAQGMGMVGHGWVSGPVSDITGTGMRVQGMTLAFSPKTIFVGESPAGSLIPLAATDIQPNDLVTVFASRSNGVDTATALYRGLSFMIQGQVTAMQADGQGHPQMVMIDGTHSVSVAQATFDGMNPGAMGSGMGGNLSGGMGSGGMMGGTGGGMGMGGGMMGDPGDPALLQMGSTVALGGIVENGMYAAAFVHVMASAMQGTGTIQSMMVDSSGHASGFVMTRSGPGLRVVMDPHTRISSHGQMMGGSALGVGMRVSVAGLSRSDGSMLAQMVQIQGHM